MIAGRVAVAYRMALDHPERLERLALLDVITYLRFYVKQ
jgi:hypothetical protein